MLLLFDIITFFSHPALAGVCGVIAILPYLIDFCFKYLIKKDTIKQGLGKLSKIFNMKISIRWLFIIIAILISAFYVAFNEPTVKKFQNTKISSSLIEKSKDLITRTNDLIENKIIPVKNEIEKNKNPNKFDVELEREERIYIEVEIHLKSFVNSIYNDIEKYELGLMSTETMDNTLKKANLYLDSLSSNTNILN